MNQNLTYRVFIEKLKKINFLEKRMESSHIILYNKEFNATIVLPLKNLREQMPNYLIKSTQKMIIEKGILSYEDFQRLFFT